MATPTRKKLLKISKKLERTKKLEEIETRRRIDYLTPIRQKILDFAIINDYHIMVSQIPDGKARFTITCGIGDRISIIPPYELNNPGFLVEIMATLPQTSSDHGIKALRGFFDLPLVDPILENDGEKLTTGCEIFYIYDIAELEKIVRIWYERFGHQSDID